MGSEDRAPHRPAARSLFLRDQTRMAAGSHKGRARGRAAKDELAFGTVDSAGSSGRLHPVARSTPPTRPTLPAPCCSTSKPLLGMPSSRSICSVCRPDCYRMFGAAPTISASLMRRWSAAPSQDLGRGRRPAGRKLRRSMFRTGRRQMHLRHRLFHGGQYRDEDLALEEPASFDQPLQGAISTDFCTLEGSIFVAGAVSAMDARRTWHHCQRHQKRGAGAARRNPPKVSTSCPPSPVSVHLTGTRTRAARSLASPAT